MRFRPETLRLQLLRKPARIPVAIAAILFFVCLGSSRALTDHEALLAGSAKEMVQSGDWLLLKIGDQPWLEKPALPQWLAALSALAFGDFNEWTMRLPFACAGVLVVWIITRLMTSLFGSNIGLLAGCIQATSVYQLSYARLAESDVMLQVFVLGAIAVFADSEFHRSQLTARQFVQRRWLFWTLLGATNFAKGLAFGGVLTLLTCFGWKLLNRDVRGLRRWLSPLPMLASLLISVAWPAAVVWRDPAVLQLWSDHTVGRAAGSFGYDQPFWYYLTTWPTQLLPWTPFFLIGLPRSWRRAKDLPDSPDRFLWWWMLSQPAILSLSSGKHHHYLIYALPACSPIMAMGLMQAFTRLKDLSRSTKVSEFSLWTALAGVLIAGIVIGVVRPEFARAAMGVAFILSVGVTALAISVSRRSIELSLCSLFALIMAGHIAAQAVVLPARDPSAADKRFLEEVTRVVTADEVLVASGCQEIARHIFYVDRPVIGIWDPKEIAAKLPPGHTQDRDWFVIARGYARSELESYGAVEILAQSQYTRREWRPADRYTLFRIDRTSGPIEPMATQIQPASYSYEERR